MKHVEKKQKKDRLLKKCPILRGIHKIVYVGWSRLLRVILYFYYVMTVDGTPSKDKMKICGAVIYILLPHDLIPDSAYLAGITDDLTALVIVYRTVKANVTATVRSLVAGKLVQWFR